MATTEVVHVDDNELFRGAMSDEAPAVEATPEPAAETPTQTERERDELGRFAPKTEGTQADAAPTQQQPEVKSETDEGGQVPSWRMRELREERDALRRQHEETSRQAYAYQQQMAEMQRQMQALQAPRQEPVDFFADPDAAHKQRIAPLEQQFAQLQAEMRMNSSKAMAIARHGAGAVDEMEKAVAEAMRNNDPNINTLRSQLATSSDPVSTAMQWYSSQQVMRETGGDIAKFKEKILADALKDPAYLAKATEAIRGQPSGTRPAINLPPSLNRMAGSGVTTSDLEAGDMSSEGLFRNAVGSRR
jgi:myosin heavy subunit